MAEAAERWKYRIDNENKESRASVVSYIVIHVLIEGALLHYTYMKTFKKFGIYTTVLKYFHYLQSSSLKDGKAIISNPSENSKTI